MTKILYVDMDNVLVDFQSALSKLEPTVIKKHENRLDEVEGIFSLMDPLPGALEAFRMLASKYDTYILSTAPWENASAWSDKLEWVKEHLGSSGYKRLICTHHKHLNYGDYLIDDRLANGADQFVGEHILFGQPPFLDWNSVLDYLIQ